jgi:hypothetical protein
MRGPDEQTNHTFSYLSPEQRGRADHPLRAIRAMTDRVFAELSPRFTKMYSDLGRPSIPPEQLLRALVCRPWHGRSPVLGRAVPSAGTRTLMSGGLSRPRAICRSRRTWRKRSTAPLMAARRVTPGMASVNGNGS